MKPATKAAKLQLLIPGRKRKKKILARFRFIKQPPTEPDRPFIGRSLFNHFG